MRKPGMALALVVAVLLVQAAAAQGEQVLLRVNCGAVEDYVDGAGQTWVADRVMSETTRWGAVGGETVRRGDIELGDTQAPGVYLTERYAMETYEFRVPPGRYSLRLHFAETYEGITRGGERVFSVAVNDEVVAENLDPWAEGGGFGMPVVKALEPVQIGEEPLRIGFRPNVQSVEINGIELVALDVTADQAATMTETLLEEIVPPPARLESAWVSPDVDPAGTYCVAWADYDGDGDLDLAFGSKWGPGNNQLYRNDNGDLVLAWTASFDDATESNGLDWADWDGDGDLDLAVGNDFEQVNRVYRNDDGALTLAWESDEHDNTIGVAWADCDGDGDADLAAANADQPNRLYTTVEDSLMLAWTSEEADRSEALAWADWDGDGDPDLAVGNYSHQPNRLYVNSEGELALAWSSPEEENTLGIAWGDYDGDGDPDLAVGNENDPNRVYENTGQGLEPAWASGERDYTRAVAWGDWDGDGDLDLAVANEGEPNRVYENTGTGFVLAWSSPEVEATIGVAWGDWDGDGDLDLACANKGQNRVYRNLTLPAAAEPALENP
jgi:hypothetical protein